jgi:streptogramin lyase
MKKWMVVLLILSALGILIVLWPFASAVMTGSTSSAASSTVSATTCYLGTNGRDVEVEITNSVPCGQEIQALASDGLVWYELQGLTATGDPGPSGDGDTESQVCQLINGGSTMTVMDGGSQTYGSQICSSEEQNGWEPK